MRRIGLAALLLLAGCSANPIASDGYYFEKGTARLPEMAVRVMVHPSLANLNASFAKLHSDALAEDRALQAYSTYNLAARVCTVHVVDPAAAYMPEFIGHELTHCLYGEFHPHQNGGA